jgi:alpha-tubulin suppressor-like RCC1 family protein
MSTNIKLTKLSLNWLDEVYNTTTIYKPDDAVYDVSTVNSYRCVKEHSDQSVTNIDYWQPVTTSDKMLGMTSKGMATLTIDGYKVVEPDVKSHLVSIKDFYGEGQFVWCPEDYPYELLMKKQAEPMKCSNFRYGYISLEDKIWVSGYNGRGGLGLGNITSQSFLQPMWYPPELGRPEKLYMGDNQTFVIDEMYNVYGCGFDNRGQLGMGEIGNKTILTKVLISQSDKVIKILQCPRHNDATYGSTYFLCSNGDLYATGYNEYGQLGIGNTTDQSTPRKVPGSYVDVVSGGKRMTFVHALTSDNEIYSWGSNNHGQLGINSTTNKSSPTLTTFSALNKTAISLYACGRDSQYGSAYVLCDDGTIACCGYNGYGQLATGDTINSNSYIPIEGLEDIVYFNVGNGRYTACAAIDINDDLWMWGYGASGLLGFGSTANRYTPSRPEPSLKFQEVYINDYHHTIARTKSDNKLYSCGYCGGGNLGRGEFVTRTSFGEMILPKPEGKIKNIRTFGYYYSNDHRSPASSILMEDGRVFTVGGGYYGQLGNNFDSGNSCIYNPVKRA